MRGAIIVGRAAREWVAGADWLVRLVAFAAVSGGVAFLAAAAAVTGPELQAADERVLRAFRTADDPAAPIGPRWVREAVRDVTALGGPAVLTLVTAGVVGYLLAGRHRPAAVFVLTAVVGGAVLSAALKAAFARPRPAVVPHLAAVSDASFPSGHAMLSAVVYLTLGAMLARLVTAGWAKAYFVLVAACLAALVGISRVYLGVHYPSDVAAGWSAGAAWSGLCWLVARRLQRRGVVDRDAG
ncbi:phosphatase PAP2 family protein [Limnoglobus roseus]|nr:phosphatase PAP2 family protein [Limnoglobus roseus]